MPTDPHSPAPADPRLDLADVRDDGNDPLRPVIARACEWMEGARAAGGSVLVHCRVGVSRSASIVVSPTRLSDS